VIVGDPLLLGNNLIHRTLEVNLSKDVPTKKGDQILEGIDGDAINIPCPKQFVVEHSKVPSSSSSKDVRDWDLNLFKSYDLVSVTNSMNTARDPLPLRHLPLLDHGDVHPFVGIMDPKDITV